MRKISKHPKLRRELNLFEVTAYAIGIIIGAGIYALIGKAAGIAGNAVWISFAIGALIAAFTGMSYAELGTLFPREAAEYVYTKKTFKNNWIPFLVSFFIIMGQTVATATVSLGFGGYLFSLIGISPIISAVCLLMLCSFINFRGIDFSVKAGIIFTAIEIIGLILIIVLGSGHIGSVNYFEMSPLGINGILGATLLIFFAYLGFEDIVNVSEETKNPRKVISTALIISISFSTLIYMLVAIVSVSVIPYQELGHSSAPLTDVVEKLLPGFSWWFSIIALFATGSTVLGINIVASRIIYGMAENKAFPKIFSVIHPKTYTPWVAIIPVFLISAFFVVFADIKTVAEITDLAAFTVFVFVNLSVIVLRYTQPKLKRRFLSPINIGKFPVLSFLGLIFCLYMLSHFDIFILYIGGITLSAGMIIHFLMKKFHLVKF